MSACEVAAQADRGRERVTSFLEPQRLWLLLVVGALAVAYVAVLRWRRAATVRFTTVDLLDEIVPRRPQWRRHVVAVLAVARPVRGCDRHRQTDHHDDGAHRQ